METAYISKTAYRRFASIGAKDIGGKKAKGGIVPALAVVVSLFITALTKRQ